MITIVMPQMGESLAEGTVVRWLKAPGDRIERDEPLFEISTDKVDAEIPSPSAGVLEKILVEAGQTVTIGTPVALLSDHTGAAAESTATVRVATTASPPEASPGGHFRQDAPAQVVSFRKMATVESRAPVGQTTHAFSPAVLDTARQAGLSLQTLTSLRGSGRGGRITKKDVERFLAASRESAMSTPAAPAETDAVPLEYLYRPSTDDQRVRMTPVRKKIAHHMSWSARISPHATAFAECDMSSAASLLEREGEAFKARTGSPLTYTVVVAHAAVSALTRFPGLNASVVGDELVLKSHVNLGIAVALADTDELVVPVVRRADELSLEGLARAISELAARARDRKLRVEDVQGGSFTLTNPGIFGGLTGTPLLNQPQVAILGLGFVSKRVVVVNDAMAIRPMAMLSLTFDHRAADGMIAFRYLGEVRRLLESFGA